jgi:3-hydroxyacyl-CoA dehydrogenase
MAPDGVAKLTTVDAAVGAAVGAPVGAVVTVLELQDAATIATTHVIAIARRGG